VLQLVMVLLVVGQSSSARVYSWRLIGMLQVHENLGRKTDKFYFINFRIPWYLNAVAIEHMNYISSSLPLALAHCESLSRGAPRRYSRGGRDSGSRLYFFRGLRL
jgi:hypothetical protein